METTITAPPGAVANGCPCGNAPCTHTGGLHTLDRSGDTRVMWDKNNHEETSAARKTFDALTAKGYVAYRAEGKEGNLGKRLRSFDANAERIILARAPVGG